MKKIVAASLILAAFGTSVAMAGVIADRQKIMQSFNTANMALRAMSTPVPPTNPNAPPIAYVAFDAAAAKAQLQIIIDGAAKLPTMFPAGSDVQGADDPKASGAQPAAFSDAAGLKAAADKLAADAKLVLAATDQASFTTAWQTMNGDCGGCHRTFRVQAGRGAGGGGRGPGGGAGGAPGGTPPAQ